MAGCKQCWANGRIHIERKGSQLAELEKLHKVTSGSHILLAGANPFPGLILSYKIQEVIPNACTIFQNPRSSSS